MRRTSVLILFAAVVGCHHDKYNLTAKFPEEYVAPSDEARYTQPDTAAYKPPPKKEEFRPGGGVGGPNGIGGAAGRGFQGGSQ